MIFSRKIKFELQSISIVENPINQRGKYVNYHFSMFSPFCASFVKEYDDKNVSEISNKISYINYYTKEGRKAFEADIKRMIFDHMPELFDINDLTSWRLATSGLSPRYDRIWYLHYSLKSYDKNTRHLQHTFDGSIKPVDKDFIHKLISNMPRDESVNYEVE